jgi:ABC-type sugar transport system substrate-binding protein
MNRYFTLFSLTLAASAVLVGCTGSKTQGQTAERTVAPGEKIKVYMLPKQKGVPYFTSCAEGAKEAANELKDVELVYDGSESGSGEESARFIDTWAMKDADVIAVSPNEPKVLAGAMKKAMGKGVKVITWDADADKDTREFLVNQATPQEIGYALVDAMAKDLGGDKATGEVAIVTASITAANQAEWIKYIKERLPKYPGLNLVATKPSDENQGKAKAVALDLMNAYPNLKGIFAISSVAFPGSAEAVEQAKKTGKVMVTGLALPQDMVNYVKTGTVKSVILWNTKDLGYLTVYVARAVKKGELKAGATTFKAGRLGELKVVGDNVMLGGVMVFNKDNIDKYTTTNSGSK